MDNQKENSKNVQRSILFSPPDISDLEIAEVVEALKSGWITTGPRTKELEKRLAEFCHTSKVVCLNSATAAEELNFRICGIGEGDEVIVPAYTYTARQMLMIYGERNPKELCDKFETRADKYTIREMVSVSLGVETIKEKINGYNAIIIGDIPSHIRNVLLKYCFEKDIRCYSIPKLSDILLRNADEIHLFDTTLLLSRNLRLTAEQLFFKRLLDIVFSLLMLVVASPFMLLIAIAIKMYDGGPVFYKQPRLTRDNQIFMILKFRSMKIDSEDQGAQLAKKKDDRVTPVGKVIRRIHFDELPQIFNILKGDMSLVGPRSERPEIVALYGDIIPEFEYRLKVKAGLTGYAQVYGKYNTTPYDKLKLDLTYIETYSLKLDLKLLMLTFKILFQKENTEGVEVWQRTAGQESISESPGECKDTFKF